MKSILAFIDGAICDDRHRQLYYGTPDFYLKENNIIYIGARPMQMEAVTLQWVAQEGFPTGKIYLSENQEERLNMEEELSKFKNKCHRVNNQEVMFFVTENIASFFVDNNDTI